MMMPAVISMRFPDLDPRIMVFLLTNANTHTFAVGLSSFFNLNFLYKKGNIFAKEEKPCQKNHRDHP